MRIAVPPARKLAALLGMAVVGAWIGLVIGWASMPDVMEAWMANGLASEARPWMVIGFSVFYTICIWSACRASMRFALRRIPLRSPSGFALHVLIIGSASLGTCLGLLFVDMNVCMWLGIESEHLNHDQVPVGLILGATGVMTVIVAAATYAFAFYRRLRDAEQAALKANLQALQAQVNPHFLFNALNSIAALVRTRPDEAEDVTTRLADLFRYTLRASQHATATLYDEVEATEMYLGIERTRFRDRLQVIFDIPRTLGDAEVPSLMLQPLVENAVKHGVAQTDGAVAVQVRARSAGSDVCLSVRDTGPGFVSTDPDVIFRRGTGLANLRDRLALFFGPDASLVLLRDGVEICFPYRPAPHHPAAGRAEARTAKAARW